eukprot:TRINITY_DN3912_c0_g1_i4.p1 TRINITY_DN3912_c0_g1~~TRINITY_DN3912_c0_g1_i4.p1  ORF type:complete len:378 (+),score=54.34 TRINITY_DN3912_c0_g1_i4:188-1321(+)
MQVRLLAPVAGKPVVIATLTGQQPSLPSVLLNGHYDVVPAVDSMWDEPPFGGVQRSNGDIYGRGCQDMKSVCIQYIEALRRLRQQDGSFLRTIHVTFVPDEEIRGLEGMGALIKTDEFKALNIGVALDEGLASDTDTYALFYGERAVWRCRVKATGPTGHGSRFIKDTAMQKLIGSLNQFLAFRAEQEELLDNCGCQHAVAQKLKLGDVVTLNLTMLKGGVTLDGGKTYALNVIPSEAEAGFDIRIPPSMPLVDLEAKIKEWTKAEGVSYDFWHKDTQFAVTSVDRRENAWYGVLSDAFESNGIRVDPQIFPAGTDSRYLRNIVGIPAFGFSPMINTPVLLHDHNERLNVDVFLKGIDIYCSIIPALANAAFSQTSD